MNIIKLQIPIETNVKTNGMYRIYANKELLVERSIYWNSLKEYVQELIVLNNVANLDIEIHNTNDFLIKLNKVKINDKDTEIKVSRNINSNSGRNLFGLINYFSIKNY